MNNVEEMRNYIDKLNIKEFTHRDIIEVTNTNCPYTVLKCLKKYYEIDYTDEIKIKHDFDIEGRLNLVKVRYRKYKILKRKENNVKKFSIR